MTDDLGGVLERVVFALLQTIRPVEMDRLLRLDERLYGPIVAWDPEFEELSQARADWCVLDAPADGAGGSVSVVERALVGDVRVNCRREELELAARSFLGVFDFNAGGVTGFDVVAGAPVEFRPPLPGIDRAVGHPWILRAVVQGSHLSCVRRPRQLPREATVQLRARGEVGWRQAAFDPFASVRRARRAWGRAQRQNARG